MQILNVRLKKNTKIIMLAKNCVTNQTHIKIHKISHFYIYTLGDAFLAHQLSTNSALYHTNYSSNKKLHTLLSRLKTATIQNITYLSCHHYINIFKLFFACELYLFYFIFKRMICTYSKGICVYPRILTESALIIIVNLLSSYQLVWYGWCLALAASNINI